MKTLLFLSWLALGGLGYFGYGFYNDTIKKQDEADKVSDALQDANNKNKLLTAEIESLQAQVDQEKKIEATLRLASTTPAPTSVDVAPTTITSATFVFPATITTISGKTYTDCKLNRADPDGVSFYHAAGVAKVAYADLDPSFSKEFGYDPQKAAEYAQQEAIREGQSDAMRQQVQASTAPQVVLVSAPAVASSRSNAKPAVDAGAIQSQIRILQDDLAEKTHLMDKEYGSTTSHSGYNGNAYVDEIASDKAQIEALQAQLGH